MDELADFETIIDRIRSIIERVTMERAFNKDVAGVLGIDEIYISTLKRRGSVPYEKILQFCKRTGIDPMTLFFKKSSTVSR